MAVVVSEEKEVRHYFRSSVDCLDPGYEFPTNLEVGVDTALCFISYKLTRNMYLEAPSRIINGEEISDYNNLVYIPLSQFIEYSKRSFFTEKVAQQLFRIGLPEDDHAALIEKLFIVNVWNVTVRYLDSSAPLEPGDLTRSFVNHPICFNGNRTINRSRVEDMIWPEPELIPVTKSCIECLERVRFDSLEDSVRQMPCAVCMKCLDYFALEQGTDEQLMIIRLPCTHLFHVHCILQWLDCNHLCPVCQYVMPTVEASCQPPSQPYSEHYWNMLKLSVGGVLTAATCFAVQMIEAKAKKTKISDYLMYALPLVAIYSAKFF